MAPKESSMPGIWKYPTYRDSHKKWLKGRRVHEGDEGLWRIHDVLYDFSSFVHKHPGGADWLLVTKGTDITEAFESHHISNFPRNMLNAYKVKEANTKRNSPYTFKDDGFYQTLRERVYQIMPEASMRGPSPKSYVIMDSLVATSFILAVGAAILNSYILAVLAGVFFAATGGAAHNFLHIRDNWRKYYMNLTLMSYKHFSVIHVLSHHLYPNSCLDLEVSLYEAWLPWLPTIRKPVHRYIAVLISPLVYMFTIPVEFFITLFQCGPEWCDLIPFVTPLLMVEVSAYRSPFFTLLLWAVTVLTTSFVFVGVGVNTGHHHPEIFHDGDTPRVDRDWGLAQIDSVYDRPVVSGVTGVGEGVLAVYEGSEGLTTCFRCPE